MRRRDFTRGIGATGLGLWLAPVVGCGAARPPPGVEALRARLDRGVCAAWVAADRASGGSAALGATLGRGLEGLVVADVLGALPVTPSAALREELDGPVRRTLAAWAGYRSLLAAAPDAVRSPVAARLADEPDAVRRVTSWIEASTDVPTRPPVSPGAGWSGALGGASDGPIGSRVLERVAVRGALDPSVAASIWSVLSAVDAVPAAATGAIVVEPIAPGSGRYDPFPVYVDTAIWDGRWAAPGDEEIEIGTVLMCIPPTFMIGLILLIVGMVQNQEWDGLPAGETP